MPSRRRFLAAAAATSSVSLAGCANVPFVGGGSSVPLGDDYPSDEQAPTESGWPAFRRDRANTACAPDADPVPEPSVRWTSPALSIDSRAWTRTVTVNGATAYACDGDAHAFDVVSGDRLWTQDEAGQRRTAPNVLDGLAWVRAGDEDETALGLDPSSGEVAERVELPGVPEYAPSPLAEYNFVVSVEFPAVGSGLDGRVVAANREEDSELTSNEWHHEVYGSGALRPATTRDTYAVSFTGELYKFARWGFAAWRTNLNRSVATQPVVGAERVYVGTESGAMAFEQDSGRILWEFDGADHLLRSAVAFDGARVFLAGETALHAVSSETGGHLWSVEFDSEVTTPPAVGGERVYVATGETVRALSVDGDGQWQKDVGRSVGSGLAVAGGRLYAVADGDGENEAVVLSLG